VPVLLNNGAAIHGLLNFPHRCQAAENLLHLRDHTGPTPIASAKKDQAPSGRPGKGKLPRIVQIAVNHGSCILRGAFQNFAIGGAIETQRGIMNRVASSGRKPVRQGRDNGISTRN
jgi:hypothetical protein